MSTLIKRLLAVVVVAGFATAATLAVAQTGPGSCNDAADKGSCMHANMAQHMQEHEAKLHDALKLTAAQEPAWKTYTDTVHQQMSAMQAEHSSMPSPADMQKLSAPDMMQQHLAMMQKHMAMMQTHLDALKKFYAVLTPEQQTTMNAALAKMHHHMHDMHGPMHGAPPAAPKPQQ